MDYINGELIKKIRIEKNLTQADLAEKLFVSAKTISKWETNRGLPDISIVNDLAAALGVSLIELFNSEQIINQNRSANLRKISYYVCPVCGNVIRALGNSVVSCCGISLPCLEASIMETSNYKIEIIDDEYVVTIDNPMSKKEFISFISYVTDYMEQFCKLYPEGEAVAHFKRCGHGSIYVFSNQEGLYVIKV